MKNEAWPHWLTEIAGREAIAHGEAVKASKKGSERITLYGRILRVQSGGPDVAQEKTTNAQE